MPAMHDDDLPAHPDSADMVDGDVKTGCDYRTLPNWLRSCHQANL